MGQRVYYVVFLNDAPLHVCKTEEDADKKVLAYKQTACAEFKKSFAYLKNEKKIEAEVRSAMLPLYYHWHDVKGDA